MSKAELYTSIIEKIHKMPKSRKAQGVLAFYRATGVITPAQVKLIERLFHENLRNGRNQGHRANKAKGIE